MANQPRHLEQQAVGKHDVKHMQKTDADRAAARDERAQEQFGDPENRVSPDVYPEYSGDTTLTARDEKDNQTPAGESARTQALAGDRKAKDSTKETSKKP